MCATSLFFTGPARADDDSKDWHLGAEIATDLPVDLAARISVEAPYRIRLSTSFGLLPGPYVQLINAVIVEAGGYGQSTAEVIESALNRSFVWRTQLGWRFAPDWGFYTDVGYSLVTFGGGVSGTETLTLATGIAVPFDDSLVVFDVDSTLHLLVVEAGYEWTLFGDHLLIRLAAGFAGTIGSSTTVEPQFKPLLPMLVGSYAKDTAEQLDDIYTSYVFTPTITVGAGYRFF